MITKINLKNITSYNKNGVEIDNLKKVNFFFGYNGSGKSTIAKYIKNLSFYGTDQYSEDYADCVTHGYDRNKHEMLVFNEQFIEENFRLSKKQKGIFSLDEINIEKQEQIEINNKQIVKYKESISRHEYRLERINKEYAKQSKQLLDDCYNERRKFEFMKVDIPSLLPYKKDDHLSKIRQYKSKLEHQKVRSYEDLCADYKQLYQSEMFFIPFIKIENYSELDINGNSLLEKIIVGANDVSISALIDKLNNRRWVESGALYIDNSDGVCPFCQQKINSIELKSELNKYFDETYKEEISKIERFKDSYIHNVKTLLGDLQELVKKYNPSNYVHKLIDSISEVLDENNLVIEHKLKYPNQKYSLRKISECDDLILKLNAEIANNNLIFTELDLKKQELNDNVWMHMTNGCLDKITTVEQWNEKSTRLFDRINTIISELNDSISDLKGLNDSLRLETANTKTAVDNINILLKSAGFVGFKIIEKSEENNIKYYSLQRKGDDGTSKNIFKSLSEGEKNFISFLYFYQLCLGTDNYEKNRTKKKIVVIDDPVSSMDTQVLFLVSTLIHRLVKRKQDRNAKDQFNLQHIEQVIVLTHNIYFYKEVTYSNRPICNSKQFYLITKSDNITRIENSSKPVVDDDYSLLWETIRNIKNNLPHDKMQNIVIANLMRRIIESYASFINLKKDVWSTISYDEADPHHIVKSGFLSFINDDSHSISPIDNLYYQRITNEDPSILFSVFKSIFDVIGENHYATRMDE